jgi:hypothetical protein
VDSGFVVVTRVGVEPLWGFMGGRGVRVSFVSGSVGPPAGHERQPVTDQGTDRSGDETAADASAARKAADAIDEIGVERLTNLIVEAAHEAPEGFDPDASDDDES